MKSQQTFANKKALHGKVPSGVDAIVLMPSVSRASRRAVIFRFVVNDFNSLKEKKIIISHSER